MELLSRFIIVILYVGIFLIIIRDVYLIIDWLRNKIKNRKCKETITLWVARDYVGRLYVYTVKPERWKRCFFPQYKVVCGKKILYDDFMRLPDDYYPEVTWENSPQRLVLNNEKQ